MPRNKKLRSAERIIQKLAQSGKLSPDDSTELKTELRHLRHALAIKNTTLLVRAISTICEVVMKAK